MSNRPVSSISAKKRGTTRFLIGSTPSTWSASSSSRILRAPRSAVIAVPATPASTIASTNGANSRIDASTKNPPRRSSAPNSTRKFAAWRPGASYPKAIVEISSGNQHSLSANMNWPTNSGPYGYGGVTAETSVLPVRIIMLPTSSSRPLMGEYPRSATALIKSAPASQVFSAATRLTAKRRELCPEMANPNRRHARVRLLCSGRGETRDTWCDLRSAGGAGPRRMRRRSPAGRQRAGRKLPGRGGDGDVPRLSAPVRAHASRARRAQHRVQDDPERRGDDLQRHLCVPRAPGRGHRRGRVRRRPPADRAGQPVAADLDRRPAPGRLQRRLPGRLDGREREPGRRGHRVLAHLGARVVGAGADGQVRLGADRGGAPPPRRGLGGGGRPQ